MTAMILIVYPTSIFPAALIVRWAIRFGIVSADFDDGALEDFYEPVLWVIERSPALEYGLDRALNSLGAPRP